MKSSVDTLNIRIGEEIQYKIEVESDTTDAVVFPEGQTFLPLEVIESYKVDTTFEQTKMRLIKKYGLTQFDSGKYRIPAQRVFINDRAFVTDSMLIEVADVPVDTTKQKMFDIKPALEVERPPFDLLKLLYWLIPILLVAGGIWYFLRRKKKKEEAEEQLPPYEEAINALRELDGAELLKQDRSKEYYSGLTEIVKRYLDREVDDSALESTSDELITRLHMHKDAGHFEFDTETIRKLDAVLKRADLVKFAKMRQLEGQAQLDRGVVEEIINETHEIIPEPTEEELLLDELYAEEQRRKRRFKRVLYGSLSGVGVILITVVILASTYGWSYLKDNIIGHPTKDLIEGRWYRSEYGVPAVVIETPVILKREELELPPGADSILQSTALFSYGSLLDQFYVYVNTAQYKQEIDPNLDQALDFGLASLENQGAKNLVVKRESFENENGVNGLKAYGSFSQEGALTKKGIKQNYEFLVFGQKGTMQQVIIAWADDDPYAEEMVSRITNSIELEVNEQ